MFDNLGQMCIGELTSVIYRQFQSYINRSMKGWEIHSSELAFLVKIPDHQPVTQSYLAGMLYCDHAIATRSLQSLSKKGLVHRSRSMQDKRAVLVSLTMQGKAAKKAALEKKLEWKDIVMEELSKADLELLRGKLQSIAAKSLEINRNHDQEEAL